LEEKTNETLKALATASCNVRQPLSGLILFLARQPRVEATLGLEEKTNETLKALATASCATFANPFQG